MTRERVSTIRPCITMILNPRHHDAQRLQDMTIHLRLEPQTLALRTVQSPTTQDDPVPVGHSRLADLCSHENLWSFLRSLGILAFQQSYLKDNPADKWDWSTLGDTVHDFLKRPAFKLHHWELGIIGLNACLERTVDETCHELLSDIVAPGTTVQKHLNFPAKDFAHGLVLVTAPLVRSLNPPTRRKLAQRPNRRRNSLSSRGTLVTRRDRPRQANPVRTNHFKNTSFRKRIRNPQRTTVESAKRVLEGSRQTDRTRRITTTSDGKVTSPRAMSMSHVTAGTLLAVTLGKERAGLFRLRTATLILVTSFSPLSTTFRLRFCFSLALSSRVGSKVNVVTLGLSRCLDLGLIMAVLAVLPFLTTAMIPHVEANAFLPVTPASTFPGFQSENLLTQSSQLVLEGLFLFARISTPGTTTSAATPLSDCQDRVGGCLVRGFPSLVLQDNLVSFLPRPWCPQSPICRIPQPAILADLLL